MICVRDLDMPRASILNILCFLFVFLLFSCSDGPGNLTLPHDRLQQDIRVPLTPQASKTNSIGMRFVLIPSGSFHMGLPVEQGGLPDEAPVHEVAILKAFYMGESEVTQRQWIALMGSNPSVFRRDNLDAIHNVYNAHVSQRINDNNPVDSVSWIDAQEFIRRLNSIETDKFYRLPTEAEWEYTAKAGSTDPIFQFSQNKFAVLSGAESLYSSMRGGVTFPVKSFTPNAWGVYDMDGNLREWCEDDYHAYNSQGGTPTLKVNRGPCWIDPQSLRITQRNCNFETFKSSFIGFRLVLSIRNSEPRQTRRPSGVPWAQL